MTHKEMRKILWAEISNEYLENNKVSMTCRLPDVGDPGRELVQQSFRYFESEHLIKCNFTIGLCTYTLTNFGIDLIESDDNDAHIDTQNELAGKPFSKGNSIPLKSGGRFKIALSFPGEHRDLVEGVAERLATYYSADSILYDKFHRAEFARLNLDLHLQELYGNESDLIVVFLCAEYDTKKWCGIEWRAIRNLINSKDADDRIMPIKCGDGEVGGIYGLIDGYIDSNEVPIDEVVSDIIKRYSFLMNDSASLPYEDKPPKADELYPCKIKIVLDGEVHSFIGKVAEMKHWIEETPLLSIAAGSLLFKIKNDRSSNQIKTDDKFFLSKKVWRIIGIDDTSKESTTVTCVKELINHETDDIENGIANKHLLH